MSAFPRLREIRSERGLSQNMVASVLECSQQVYSDYERGSRTLPVGVLICLSLFYNVTTDYILGLSDISNRDPSSAERDNDV